jgi:hypothetical protein
MQPAPALVDDVARRTHSLAVGRMKQAGEVRFARRAVHPSFPRERAVTLKEAGGSWRCSSSFPAVGSRCIGSRGDNRLERRGVI